MINYLLKRLVALIPILLIVAIFVFFIIRVVPGNPAAMMLGPEATSEDIEFLSKQMGLDRPIPIQFLEWIFNVVKGDFGNSIFFRGQPVRKVIFEHFKPTLTITLLSITLSTFFGIIFGVLAAINHNNIFDRLMMAIATAGTSIPGFWLGLMAVFYFSINLGILPPAGYKPLSEGLLVSSRYMVLPVLTLAFRSFSLKARMTRSSMLEILGTDYIRTARAKGLSEFIVNYKHAFKNVLIILSTVIGLGFASLLGGTVITETIFNIPGLGRLLVSSVFSRDYPVVEGIVIYFTITLVIVNLITDFFYVIIDPRIKY